MKRFPLFPVLLVLLVLVVPLAAALGAADLTFGQVAEVLASGIFPGKFRAPDQAKVIVFSVRLPRIVLAGIAGAALGLAGAVFQAVFRNPLAEPYLLGVSSGAALGASAAIVLGGGAGLSAAGLSGLSRLPGLLGLTGGGGLWLTAFSAFAGAVLTGVLVFLIAGSRRGDFSVLLLGGIALGYLFQGIVSLLMMLNRSTMERIVFWMMGSFSSASWDKAAVGGIFLLAAGLYIQLEAKTLNLLSLGSQDAHALGINPARRGTALLAAASLLTAAVVSVSGVIGFVGLLVPHLVRFIKGPDHRRLLPCAALLGAVLMILADTCARTLLAPREIPVGIITAFLGVPFFLFLLKRRGRGGL